MSSQLPKISIIIPVRNEEHHLEKAVESVFAQNYPGESEIILAVGPSSDKTMEVAQALKAKYPTLVILENQKGLTTTGLNLAIAKSSGSIIVRVDAHSELGENYLLRGVEILEQTGSVLLGGIMQARGKSPLQKAVAFGYNSRLGLGGGSYHLGGKEGEAESAYLGIFRADALRAAGGYDEKIIRGEDWDLAQRLRANGGKVYFSPELIVDYWPRSNLRALAWQFYSTGVWRGELTRRAPSKASFRYFIPPIALLVLADLLFLSVSGYLDYRMVIVPI
ncbi:MAG: glycosyltransferase family 2 protein, partial [Actinomycetota bacterium]